MDKHLRNQIVGFSGCILLVCALIPQLYKIVKNKSSKNISIHTYVILFVANIVWCVYGILNDDLQVTVTNVITSFITLLIIVASLYYRH
jgi:MtN3 and saliva related transmembrane protein